MASGYPNAGQESGSQSPTGLLPRNAFGGKSPEVGDVCKFRVVQIYDDQIEVEYVQHRDTEEPEPGEAAPVSQPPEEDMSQLME
jgi:hypothetical protein